MFQQGVIQTIQPNEWRSIISKPNEKIFEGKLPEKFSDIMAELNTCLASSGAIERIIYSSRLIWTKVIEIDCMVMKSLKTCKNI